MIYLAIAACVLATWRAATWWYGFDEGYFTGFCRGLEKGRYEMGEKWRAELKLRERLAEELGTVGKSAAMIQEIRRLRGEKGRGR